VVDEAIIDANPSAVFKALIDECNGRTHWWMPSLEAQRTNTGGASARADILTKTLMFPEKLIELLTLRNERMPDLASKGQQRGQE